LDDLGIGLFNHHHTFIFDDFCFYLHLFSGLQVSLLLCLLAHALDSVHDVGLLCQYCVSKVCGPLDVIGKPLDNVREGRHRLDAGVPRLFHNRVDERLVFQVFVLCKPLLELHDLQRIRGCSKDLGKQRIRVESNGCN
jgi:hypothetical protein